MYCRNCGTKNDDQSRFCIKCGQELKSNVAVGKKQNSAKKKTRSLYMAVTALVLVAAIIVVSVFDLWPWTADTDEKVRVSKTQQEDISTVEQEDSGGGTVTFEKFSLDEIIAQCPDCQAAMETYIEMIKVCQDWTTSTETIEALENRKCAQMQHFCTARSIYVENIPYAYHGSFGLYTGDWIGAGPAGSGSYTGTVYGTNIVSYTGDWGFGMPYGNGELYLENYLGAWDMTYTGQMKNGMRDGVGSWVEYYDDGGYHEPTYRIYDEAVYSQDQLTDWTDCVKYDAETGEILEYCKMKTDQTGMPLMGETWGPRDLSPEQEYALGIATVAAVFGVTAYLTYEAVTASDSYDSDAGNQRMLAEVNAWREQKEAQEQENLAREEKEKASQKAWAGDMLDRLDAGEIPYYEGNRSYYESLYYGN